MKRKQAHAGIPADSAEPIAIDFMPSSGSRARTHDAALAFVETIGQPILALDKNLRIKIANRAFYRAFPVLPRDVTDHAIYSLGRGSWDVPRLRESLDGLLNRGVAFSDLEIELDFPGLQRRNLALSACRIDYLDTILLAIEDTTERKAAGEAARNREDGLRQSQKMETVGRLAGGIAHDFNNLLTAIIGYASLLCEAVSANDTALQQVLEIKTAGERAASLTQQLLAFSRQQALQSKVLDLNAIVSDFDKMLQRLVGERIHVAVACGASLWRVRADPGEIGRVIMNLALNARDAMPAGGTLAIETANVTLSAADTIENLAPGRYVKMAVSDTGAGMDAEVLRHIFEPFYTTKESGIGTGMGLSIVFGIVEESGGAIRCESASGEGTLFTILLPAIEEQARPAAVPAADPVAAPRGSEVILLVEDEDLVRALARTILESGGYVVHEARNGREGLALCETHAGPIDLLISDVVMPGLCGRELAERAIELRPAIRVLFMSGHTHDVIVKEGVWNSAAFLQKPFTPTRLRQRVREALDSRLRSARHAS